VLGADSAFQVKRVAMVILCMHFDQVTNTEKAKYWAGGIATHALAALADTTGNHDMADAAHEICQDHDVDNDMIECICHTELEL
jgi:hypothetical protein